jgi:peptide/nickel transport system substrate-binding protein
LAEPTCQVLPPNFPGYRPYCPYTRNPTGEWKGPRLEQARALVGQSGTRGARVRVWSYVGDSPFEEKVASATADVLLRLGYRPQVKVFKDVSEYYSRVGGAGADSPEMGVGGWTADFPAAYNFFHLLTCANDVPGGSFNPNFGHFCDPRLDRKVARARRLQTTNPTVANAEWQEVDRYVVDQGAWVPLLNPVEIDFLSERVGNYQRHPSPQFGMLLSQLWVR